MTMATLGWGVVWVDLALARLAPSVAPDLRVAAWIALSLVVLAAITGVVMVSLAHPVQVP